MSFGFPVDQSCPGIAASLRGAVYRLVDVGIATDASDELIFEEAQERELIIATNNPADFQRIMRRATHRAGKRRCGDGWGLLVPNQLKMFDFEYVTCRLRFNAQRIDWEDVTEMLRYTSGASGYGGDKRCAVQSKGDLKVQL